LFAMLGDLVTTYLATPTLELETNPIARRLGWKFGVAGLLVCLLPYWSLDAAMVVFVASLLASAGNAGRVWLTRALGEQRQMELLLEAASRSQAWQAYAGVAASAGFIALTGSALMFFYPSPEENWGFWFGLGIVGYGLVIAIYGALWVRRLFRQASSAASVAPSRAT